MGAITKVDVINDIEWVDLIELEISEYLSNYNFEIFLCNSQQHFWRR